MFTKPFNGAPCMTKTLILVTPPQKGLLEGFSTGLIALGNYVRQYGDGINVRFLDLGLIPTSAITKSVASELRSTSGQVFFGITGTTASYQGMLATASAVKALAPDSVVIFGGHHAGPQDEVVFRHHTGLVDFIIRGEGEIALLALIRNYPSIENVTNLSYLKEGRMERTPEAKWLGSDVLDRLKPSFDPDSLPSTPGKFDHVTYVSARGCPLKCAFCAVGDSGFRSKSIPAIIDDLRHIVQVMGKNRIAIEDNFFAHQPHRTLELCNAIADLVQEVPFSWDCQTRLESMKRPDVVAAMARANCEAAYLGIEALDEEHLLYLAKTLRPEDYLRILEEIVIPQMMDVGIDAYINLQLGIPGETNEHRTTTLRRLRRLGQIAKSHGRAVTVFPQLNVIYPGTPHFKAAVETGRFGTLGFDVFESFTLWESQEEPILTYLGEHFAHGVGGIPIGILDQKLLKSGTFRISEHGPYILSTYLRQMEAIDGIQVFKYGDYLVRDNMPELVR
tara:strand:- start:5707 stop:7221 length:1515 start_codon:yes stop_codon:yes gene_type:complete